MEKLNKYWVILLEDLHISKPTGIGEDMLLNQSLTSRIYSKRKWKRFLLRKKSPNLISKIHYLTCWYEPWQVNVFFKYFYQVYELERREKEEKMTAILMFAVEALKIKYKPGYNNKHQKKKNCRNPDDWWCKFVLNCTFCSTCVRAGVCCVLRI